MKPAERSRIVTLLSDYGYGARVNLGVLQHAREQRVWEVRQVADVYDREFARAVRPIGIIGQFASPARLDLASELGVPAVNVSGVMETHLPLVTMDNEAIGAMAARHLLDRKYNQLCCFFRAELNYSMMRARGFQKVAEQYGANLTWMDYGTLHLSAQQAQREQQLAVWLRDLPKPSGLFMAAGWGNFMLGSVAQAAQRRIPEDLAVVMVGDDPIHCERDDPPISSVDYDAVRVGYEAATLLQQLVAGRKAPTTPILILPTGVTERASTSTFGITDSDVLAALRYINDHACRGIGVMDVCDAALLSHRTLHRRFMQLLGRSMQKEILRVRLEHAKYLLARTDLAPATIAHRSGLRNVSRLCHTFRQHVGLSPGQYRAQYRPRD